MKKIVIIPDSFKGTMSSKEVGEIIKEEALASWPEVEVIRAEVADGGEGSVEAFLSVLPGNREYVTVSGPYGEPVTACYGMLGETAVIEMAAAAGLPLVGENLSAGATTTYGVGELILAALDKGAKKLILGLGGSATNDGGTGMAAALGIRFLDEEGRGFVPVGNTLEQIAKIEMDGVDHRLKNVEIIAMCDIRNTLCGTQGAAVVFGPQKGATEDEVRRLDKGLFHLAKEIEKVWKKDVLEVCGGAAAGGMGAGAAAFLGARLQSGIDVVLETIHFDKMLEDCSLVITGEGKIDGQSIQGKVVSGVARRAAKKNVPVLVVVGAIDEGAEAMYDAGVSAIFSINQKPLPFEAIQDRTKSDLRKTVRTIFRFAKVAKQIE